LKARINFFYFQDVVKCFLLDSWLMHLLANAYGHHLTKTDTVLMFVVSKLSK